MEFDQLKTFLAVIEHHSFVRAGRALHIGQSTVSFHVKALEEAVGSSLIERGRGRIAPTATGRVLLQYASRLVALREEARARVQAEESGEVGRLVIAASTIPGEYLLPPFLAEFRTLHPRISVEVDVSDSERATARALARDCDLALVGRKPRDRRLAVMPFGRDEIVLVGPVPNPFAPQGRLSSRDLRAVPLILREPGSGTREAVSRILPQVGQSDEHRAPTLRIGSTEAAKRCVQHGLGLAFLSRLAVADEVAAGSLEVVALPDTPVRREFHALRLRSADLPSTARAFLELVHRRNR